MQEAIAFEHQDKYDRQRLVRPRQGSDFNDFIYEFNSRCLAARDLDELTKTVLFIEGLLDVVKGVERCHLKTRKHVQQPVIDIAFRVVSLDKCTARPFQAFAVVEWTNDHHPGPGYQRPSVNS